MAYKYMAIAPTPRDRSEKPSYEYEETLTAQGNGSWVILPSDITVAVVSVIVSGGGQGKVQSSTNLVSTLIAGSGETAFDWSAGAVGANTQDVAKPCNGIRLVQTSVGGTVKIQINAR